MNRMDPSETGRVPAGVSLEALLQAPFSLVITNPALEGNPIVFVNAAFERTTGYSSDQAVGQNCRFLQGEDTDPKTIAKLRDALDARTDVTVDIVNYRADGSKFWNRLFISPLTTGPDRPPYFLGIQTDLGANPAEFARLVESEKALVELRHRVKNHLAMIVGMIRLQARQSGVKGEFQSIARRVEALQLLYEELSGTDRSSGDNGADHGGGQTELLSYGARIGQSLVRLEPALQVKVDVVGDSIVVPLPVATQIGLTLSELVTNSLKHGYSDGDDGLITVRFERIGELGLRVTVEDDGSGFDPGLEWPSPDSLGGKILSQLVAGLGGELNHATSPTGTRIWFEVPNTVAPGS